MFAELPIGLDDPGERLRAISAQMDGLKESKQAVAGEALTSLSALRRRCSWPSALALPPTPLSATSTP